jgi:hypothetical protein
MTLKFAFRLKQPLFTRVFSSAASKTPKKSRFARRSAFLLGSGSMGAAAFLYLDSSDTPLQHYATAVARSTRTVTTTTSILVDYLWTLNLGNKDKDEAEYKTCKSACHKRSAVKLLELCKANG